MCRCQPFVITHEKKKWKIYQYNPIPYDLIPFRGSRNSDNTSYFFCNDFNLIMTRINMKSACSTRRGILLLFFFLQNEIPEWWDSCPYTPNRVFSLGRQHVRCILDMDFVRFPAYLLKFANTCAQIIIKRFCWHNCNLWTGRLFLLTKTEPSTVACSGGGD